MLSAKESAKTFLWTTSGAAIEFAIQMIAARILGAAEYGKANLVLGYTTIIAVVLGLGLPPVVTREVSKNPKFSRGIFSYFALISVFVDGVFLVLVILVTKWYFERLGLPLYDVWFVIAFLFVFHLSSVFYSYLIGIRRQSFASFLKFFTVSSIKTVVFLFLIFLYPKIGHESFLIASASAFLIFCLFSITHLGKPFKISEIFKDVFQFYAISIIYSTFDNLAKVLQGSFSDSEHVGYLSVGQTLGKAGMMVGMVLATMAMPEFSYYWHKGEKMRVEEIFKQATRWSVYITLPMIFIIMFNIEDILKILGKDYRSGEGIILTILLAQFFNNFVGPNGTLLNMSGNQKYEIFNGILSLSTFMVMVFLIGRKFPWGVALSLSIGIVAINILKMIEVGTIYKIWPYTKKTLVFLVVIASLQAFTFKFFSTLKIGSFGKLGLSGVIFLLFLIITFALSPEKEDRKIFHRILRNTR